ncbi:MAG: DUF433 domain-containing protein [Acidobacteria bacterium]|nr:DUF433 domain-containing protein [Acidobacteriota bacterium]
MNAVLEQIAPETIDALVAQATANGLSVNEYLQRLLKLKSKETGSEGSSLTEVIEEINGEKYEYLPLGKYVVAARGVCGGRPTIKYHRLDARHVLALIKIGEAPDQVAKEYGIPVAAVEEVIALAAQYDYEASYI